MTNSLGVNVRDYKTVLGHFCTGVTVVASIDDGEPTGFTCQSFSALSLEPPLVLVCVRKESATWPGIRKSGLFAVSVLAADQQSVGDRFARSGVDRFMRRRVAAVTGRNAAHQRRSGMGRMFRRRRGRRG